MSSSTRTHLLALSSVLILALLMRLPLINSGIPYFYDEDEAHHFNRQVNMIKTGELNPKYFLKPSLNFYLRLPVLSSGFLWSVRNGQARSIQDVNTSDKFGLAGYAFSTSHPALLKANRLYSVLISLLIIASVYLLSFLLTNSIGASFVAALTACLTALAFKHSISIGVNQPTALFCILSILFSTYYLKSKTFWSIFLSAAFAGFAISTKYNALPIVAVPLITCFLGKPLNFWHIIAGAKLPCLFFILASPFILVELPLFLDHVAYEVWHYGVEGHVGHMANPGLEQLIYYLNQLTTEYGFLFLTLSIIGFIFLFENADKKILPIYIFVILYALLMIFQKANFNRNLLLILPMLSVFTAVAWKKITSYKFVNNMKYPILIFAVIYPCLHCFDLYSQKTNIIESRIEAFKDLHTKYRDSKLAIDGELQIQPFILNIDGKKTLSRPDTHRVNLDQTNLSNLIDQDYQLALVPLGRQFTSEEKQLFKVEKIYKGSTFDQRIVQNPAMLLISF